METRLVAARTLEREGECSWLVLERASSERCDARRHTARPPEGRLTMNSDDKGREREREARETVRRDEQEPLPKFVFPNSACPPCRCNLFGAKPYVRTSDYSTSIISRSFDANSRQRKVNCDREWGLWDAGRVAERTRQEAPRGEEGTSARVRLNQASLLPHQRPRSRSSSAHDNAAPRTHTHRDK